MSSSVTFPSLQYNISLNISSFTASVRGAETLRQFIFRQFYISSINTIRQLWQWPKIWSTFIFESLIPTSCPSSSINLTNPRILAQICVRETVMSNTDTQQSYYTVQNNGTSYGCLKKNRLIFKIDVILDDPSLKGVAQRVQV